ncbi:MAG TPA: HAD-IA family hydrolase [Thermoanaerobaculia bacterium]|nr:HAD-IA family hydrolase [Thermoanaerobaculia bacterium]
MERRYDIVTFDCYGTLIDWESGIADAFRNAGIALDREEVLRRYAAIEPVVEHERYRPYREVLTETATRITGGDGAFLAASLPEWKPFPDTNAALERLRDAGYELGILSNVDDDLLAGTRRHFTVSFDLIVTAQQVRSYKPARGHFDAARTSIGDARWLHAAQSNFHDIAPATLLGIDNAWVNRHGESGGVKPTYEVRDLGELASLLSLSLS